ncbi:hypothetical protein B9T31_14565 [Acinetobacter sp. ANC 4558]|nr:hypothetical protein B9T31_14565 [Acinetobacter sp. ANC 4558]
MILLLLPQNLDSISNLRSNTEHELKASVYRNILYQLSILKDFEEISGNQFNVSEKIINNAPMTVNRYCLLNKFVLSYGENIQVIQRYLKMKQSVGLVKIKKRILQNLKEKPISSSLNIAKLNSIYNLYGGFRL